MTTKKRGSVKVNTGLVYRNRIRELERQLAEKGAICASQVLRISFLSRERSELKLKNFELQKSLREAVAEKLALVKGMHTPGTDVAGLQTSPPAPEPKNPPGVESVTEYWVARALPKFFFHVPDETQKTGKRLILPLRVITKFYNADGTAIIRTVEANYDA